MERSYRRARAQWGLVLALLVCLSLGGAPSAHAQSDIRYFAETGHYLRGAFRYFWEANGGVAVFGLPVTEEYRRSAALNR